MTWFDECQDERRNGKARDDYGKMQLKNKQRKKCKFITSSMKRK
jgi:hypothetical protein